MQKNLSESSITTPGSCLYYDPTINIQLLYELFIYKIAKLTDNDQYFTSYKVMNDLFSLSQDFKARSLQINMFSLEKQQHLNNLFTLSSINLSKHLEFIKFSIYQNGNSVCSCGQYYTNSSPVYYRIIHIMKRTIYVGIIKQANTTRKQPDTDGQNRQNSVGKQRFRWNPDENSRRYHFVGKQKSVGKSRLPTKFIPTNS